MFIVIISDEDMLNNNVNAISKHFRVVLNWRIIYLKKAFSDQI